jgi:GNAT superfamily N-acetyltransferase
MENIPVVMIRETLEDVPQFTLPAPYAVRWYRPGDEETWLRVQRASDKYGTFPPDKFEHQFGRDEQALRERQCYLCDAEGHEIGTITAWFVEYRGQRYGRIHWVAVVPEMQGRGLSKPLMTVACNRLRELGHDRAYLDTATVRVPAINLYLKFGFLPDIRGEDDLRAWRLVGPHLRPQYRDRAAAQLPELA